VNDNDKFVPELHDIGKLVDREALKRSGVQIKGHTFHNFDFSQIGISQPSSPSWYAQYFESEMVKEIFGKNIRLPEVDLLNSSEAINHIPDPKTRADVLLTKIADGVSAAISRLDLYGKRITRGEVIEGIHKLWNHWFYESKKQEGGYWSPYTDVQSFKEMFQYIDSCKSHQDFFRKYGEYLSLTPEDKTAPGNIVSLYTHLELVGKIYRVLRKHSSLQKQNARYVLIYNNQAVRSVQEACGYIDFTKDQGKWIYRLVFCYINFPQSLSRLQDLNVFRKRADLIKSLSEDKSTKDYVLFFADDFICLFIPGDDEVRIEKLLEPFMKSGFIIDYADMEAELNLLTSFMERAYKKFHSTSATRHLKLYEKRANFDFSPEIRPHLCDSCQMRHGKERVKDQIHEYLCDTCYGIREMGEPAREYAEWEEKGLRAAWTKITLDQEQLLSTLHRLYEEYVDTHSLMKSVPEKDKVDLKESFRPLAVQMDFVKDYKLLLKAFNNQIYEIKDNEGNPFFTKENFLFPIEGYYEFGIFKVYSGEDILSVIDLFYNLLEKYFPECLKNSPIKLSISLAPVKYPYQAHWRFFSVPENIINIQSPGSAELSMNIFQYRLLREKIGGEDLKLSHFLHRLAEIETETKSNLTVMLEIFNNQKKFPALLELTRNGLSAHQILDFYKLTCEVAIS